MNRVIVNSLLAISFLFANSAQAKGEYSVQIKIVTEERYAVTLISSYSSYYDESLKSTFASSSQALEAGKIALKKLMDSGVDAEPEHCWYDVDWL